MRIKSLLFLAFLIPVVSVSAQVPQTYTSLPSSPTHPVERPILSSEAYSIYPDRVVWGGHEAVAVGDSMLRSSFEGRSWHRTKDLSAYPSFQSDYPILNALYAMSVEELDNLIEQDSTWRTGKWWGGVWTRDISYSALLAAAYMQPDVTRISLMKKVGKGGIIEDTGTGGSWPVSTDRIVWTLAAWQVFLATGDSDWLRQSYQIVDHTLRQDHASVYDPETGLYRGESSFLDWREETYPRWMEPVDISQSECLGTNALYFRAFQIASLMAQQVGDKKGAEWYRHRSEALGEAINRELWLEDKGYYSQYLYGGSHKVASPRSETLGEALCVLFGIAGGERGQRVVGSVDLTPLGTPCISPQIPNIYPYHNNAVWPFVQAFWMQASAMCGNTASLNHSIGAILRAAAIFATSQENFVAATGDYHTAMNSPNMLWSINGQLSIFHHVFGGIRLREEELEFRPFIPKQWAGTYRISHFKVREADLDIVVKGFGNAASTVEAPACDIYLDGAAWGSESIPYDALKGRHTILIMLDGQEAPEQPAHFAPVRFSPETTPEVYLADDHTLAWRQVPEADHYKVLRNGQLFATHPERIINDDRIAIPLPDEYAEYQVVAVDKEGVEGFASKPLPYYDLDNEILFDMTTFAPAAQYAPCKGWTGGGAVEVAVGINDRLEMVVEVPRSGDYLIDFRYANGSGDLLGYNMCCNRTLLVNGKKVTQMIFPQRGKDLWQLWGWCNKARVHLRKGRNVILLSYGRDNVNMNAQEINRAMLDQMRLLKI